MGQSSESSHPHRKREAPFLSRFLQIARVARAHDPIVPFAHHYVLHLNLSIHSKHPQFDTWE